MFETWKCRELQQEKPELHT